MKKFLKYCALFVLLIVVMAISVEFILRQVPNTYKYKYEWMQDNAEDVEVLVLGPSDTYNGIRPEFLEGNAFSLANVAQDFKQDLALLKYWADRYKRLKTVIVPVSYMSWFINGMEYGAEKYRCRYYKIYMDCSLYPDWSLYNLEVSDIRSASKKLVRYFRKEDGISCDKYGFGTHFGSHGKNMEAWNKGTDAVSAVKRHTADSFEFIEANYERMKEMAEFCKNRNVRMILITTPCWSTYYDNLDEKQLAKMYELIHRLQQEYNLPYFDYLKDSRFVADDFHDCDHLSDIGAEKFTKILNKDIQSR